jgi:O-antigen ligase
MRHKRIADNVLLVIIIACAILSFMQVNEIETSKLYSYTYGYGKRYMVLGQNPNNTANNLALGLVSLIGLVFAGLKIRSRLLYLLLPLAPLIGAAVVRSGSRGGLLALASGMAVLLLGSVGGKSLWLKIRNTLVVTMAIASLFWMVTQSKFLTSRFEAGSSGHMSGRENIYPAAWQMFLDKPLAGWGPVQNTAEMWKRAPVTGREHVPYRTIHNMYLGALTSIGLVGSIPLFICLGTCVAAAWRARRGERGLLPLALVATMLMINISGDWSLSKLDWLMLCYATAAATHLARVRVPKTVMSLRPLLGPRCAGARSTA